jgi:hypothetical protein
MRKLILAAAAVMLVAGCASEPPQQYQAPQNAASRPAPKNSYGAIAASRATLATGYAINQDTPQDAERLAMQECEKNSEGNPCQVRVHIRNACGAIADGTNMHAGYAWGTTKEKAEAQAMRNCSVYGQNCQISASFCSAQRPATSEEIRR